MLSVIALNVGEILISELRYFKNHGGTYLLFPSFITKLCKMVEVEKYVVGTWAYLDNLICLLKFIGEGTSGQSKKRKMDTGKLVQEDTLL